MVAGAVAIIGAIIVLLRGGPHEPGVIDAEFREV